MQKVDHYLRQAKAALDLAASADSEPVRTQFKMIATTWEQLAEERLTELQAKLENKDGR